jgi:hypothetical protein
LVILPFKAYEVSLIKAMSPQRKTLPKPAKAVIGLTTAVKVAVQPDAEVITQFRDCPDWGLLITTVFPVTPLLHWYEEKPGGATSTALVSPWQYRMSICKGAQSATKYPYP